ncbi:sensor histidine kinase [Nitrospira sp. KM1]|uniref:ATP-binding protein n=1 Tax=Nitrospira sp. KM1 TaxID=1936990 RepID=UPI0013A75474|nr:ATP-binding protein [Nitrospira sp. KM1]BCA53793.1 sensor histidine kinase [Nitrospira sp. KM1]
MKAAELRTLPLFAGLTEAESNCLEHGEEIQVPAGELLIREGSPAEYFYVILEGEIRVTKLYGGQEIMMTTHTPGKFFGEVPLLLNIPHMVDGKARKPSRLLRYSREAFWSMMRGCPSVATEILRTMATRLRALEGFSQQREKLVSLGTMAAGLAHELNNPASAARRAAADLRVAAAGFPSLACRLNKRQLSQRQSDALIQIQQDIAARSARQSVALDPVARSDQEEQVAAWLNRHGVSDSWDLAGTFVGTLLDQTWLEHVAGQFPADAMADVLKWVAGTLTIEDLVRQVDQSTTRISDLVNAVKSYSYEGRAPLQAVDIHEGLESTLTILSHKLKHLTVSKEYDKTIPVIHAYGNELNQVWTNLIDNASDAAGPSGHIWIRTRREDNMVVVEIQDNGPGIAEEIRPRLFEPFFTTKGVGKGTGLGLIISYRIISDRHSGEIEFESKPGDTRFFVRLPLAQPGTPIASE